MTREWYCCRMNAFHQRRNSTGTGSQLTFTNAPSRNTGAQSSASNSAQTAMSIRYPIRYHLKMSSPDAQFSSRHDKQQQKPGLFEAKRRPPRGQIIIFLLFDRIYDLYLKIRHKKRIAIFPTPYIFLLE